MVPKTTCIALASATILGNAQAASSSLDFTGGALLQQSAKMMEVINTALRMSDRYNNVDAKIVGDKFICLVAGALDDAVKDVLDKTKGQAASGRTRGQMYRAQNDARVMDSERNKPDCKEVKNLLSQLDNFKRRRQIEEQEDMEKRDSDTDFSDDNDGYDSTDDNDHFLYDSTNGVVAYGLYRGLKIVKDAARRNWKDPTVNATALSAEYICPMTDKLAQVAENLDKLMARSDAKHDMVLRKIAKAQVELFFTPNFDCKGGDKLKTSLNRLDYLDGSRAKPPMALSNNSSDTGSTMSATESMSMAMSVESTASNTGSITVSTKSKSTRTSKATNVPKPKNSTKSTGSKGVAPTAQPAGLVAAAAPLAAALLLL